MRLIRLFKKNRLGSENTSAQIEDILIPKRSILICMCSVMVILIAYPTFSQTGRSYSASRNTITSSQPKPNTYPSEELKKDPHNSTAIVSGSEDAGYRDGTTEYGKNSDTVTLYSPKGESESGQTTVRKVRRSHTADRTGQIALREDKNHSNVVRNNKNLPVRMQYYEKKSARQQVRSCYADDREYEFTILAVKTNLLFDAVTALNVELEVPVGDSWSVAGEYIFPWWLNEKKQNCFQLISGSLELRRWLGYRDEYNRLTGWFGGLFIGGGYFDLERDKKGYQGESYLMTGLSGGYAHEISRDGKWRMEYSLGLGYMTAKYREYNAQIGIDNEWHLIRKQSGNISFTGPLRAKISLVWTLKRK